MLRTPAHDDEELGLNRLFNNSFGYARQTGTLQLRDGRTTAGRWPEAPADPVGLVCPMAAHIRKVNTRETPNDMGASRASLDRRILRHGITYGRGIDEPDASPDDDRGLLFLSYQASIVRQFEFLNNRWMNSAVNPRSPSGHDLIVGQNGQPKQGRVRSATVYGKDLSAATVTTERDFVIPTGGEYFFSPSVSALRGALGDAAPRPPRVNRQRREPVPRNNGCAGSRGERRGQCVAHRRVTRPRGARARTHRSARRSMTG